MLTNPTLYLFFLSIFLALSLSFSPSLYTVHPLVQVPNQLVGAPVLTDVTLICNVEASPKAINYWQRENGKLTSPSHPLPFPLFRFFFFRFFTGFFLSWLLVFSGSWFINLSMPQFVFIWFVFQVRNIFGFFFGFQLHLTYIANVTARVDSPAPPSTPPPSALLDLPWATSSLWRLLHISLTNFQFHSRCR